MLAEGCGVLEPVTEGFRTVPVKKFGGVKAVGECGGGGVAMVSGELPVGALRGLVAGGVGVGGDDRVRSGGGELCGLGVGECGAEGGEAVVAAVAGEGDGDRVERSFD